MPVNTDSLFSVLKAQRREAAAESVFHAAEEVIVAKGVEGATMQDIARRAGCAAGTLYLYFRNKEELITLLLGRHMKDLERLFRDAVSRSDDGMERFRRGLQVSLDYCHKHRLLLRVFFSTPLGGSPDIEAHLKGDAREAYANMKAMDIDSIRRAQAAGQVRTDVSADELVELAYGLFNAAIARWLLRSPNSDVTRQMEMIWSFLARGLGMPEGLKV